MNAHTQPILIVACGNITAGDDAFGPLVAAALRESILPTMQIVDLGTKPAALLDHLPGPELLVVVDAVLGRGAPVGRLIDMDWFDPTRPALVGDAVISSHGLSIADEVVLADRLGVLPEQVRLIACTIDSAQVGQPAQKAVCDLVPVAVNRILDDATKWLGDSNTDRAKDEAGPLHA